MDSTAKANGYIDLCTRCLVENTEESLKMAEQILANEFTDEFIGESKIHDRYYDERNLLLFNIEINKAYNIVEDIKKRRANSQVKDIGIEIINNSTREWAVDIDPVYYGSSYQQVMDGVMVNSPRNERNDEVYGVMCSFGVIGIIIVISIVVIYLILKI